MSAKSNILSKAALPRRGTQVVRERSAKPLCAGSIPARASNSSLINSGTPVSYCRFPHSQVCLYRNSIVANRRKLGSIGERVGPKPDRTCTENGASSGRDSTLDHTYAESMKGRCASGWEMSNCDVAIPPARWRIIVWRGRSRRSAWRSWPRMNHSCACVMSALRHRTPMRGWWPTEARRPTRVQN